jgi:type 1 glutamine amidotransferase
MLLPLWGQYPAGEARTQPGFPPEAQEPGFGVYASKLIQTDDDPALEEVFLFSRDKGHYPCFDIFSVYYVITDHATRKLKYKSDIVLTTERELTLEDRNRDGIYELYRKYFRDGQFLTDKEGNNLQTVWVYDSFPATVSRKTVAQAPGQTKIRTLLITCEGGSHWLTGGSDAIRQILENSDLFTTDLVVAPSQDDDLASFSPDFGKYDLVVMNYDGKTWPEQTRNNFEQFVSNGGGLAIVHSSVIPMSDWPPYNEMTGLGAWGNRNEQSGPYVYWQDGRYVYDHSPGPGGHHGLQHSFAVTHRNPEHPILKGLPPVWQHVKDELYVKLRGPAKNMEILATASEEPDRHEPVLWTVNYGKGNVFVTLLGHAGNDPRLRYAMDCTGFQVTLLRGAEWAATGQVTQQAPEDFPGEGVVSLRKEYKAPSQTDSDKEPPVRLAFISGMNPVFDTTLYAPLLTGFEGVVWKAYTTEESIELFKPENKSLYDVIVFHDICLEEIPESAKQHIAGVIREGKPAFILHDGLLTYNKWPEFARIAGMKYFMSAQTADGIAYGVSKYKHQQDIPVTVADKDHFITQGMDEHFVLHDEIYNALWQSPDIHVLWTTSHPESARDVMYTHSYGKGKVVGIVMGHGPDLFFDRNFRLAFQRGIRWLAQPQKPDAPIRLTQDPELEKAIIRTGLIHSPLPVDYARSFEANGLRKKIIRSEPLSLKKGAGGWTHSGLGSMAFSAEKSVSGQGSIKMAFPTSVGKRAQGPPSDPDYATYGNSRISFDTGGANWEKYNRIAFCIYPDCDGARVVNLNLGVQSASHLINLVNKQWNQCFLDLEGLPRDNVKEITFGCSIKGKDRTTGDSSVFYIDRIELQQIEGLDPVSGWHPGKNKIIYSASGYMADGPKSALITVNGSPGGTPFSLIEASTGSSVYTGRVTATETTLGNFLLADFTSYKGSGEYRLKVNDVETPPFPIGDNIWENSLWRTLNFIFCQRCGYPVPGIHGTCHTDLCSVHNGQMISYAGGWHDAGDLSQQTLQTGDVTFALLEAYNKLKDKNALLAARLLEEAEWGLEFVVRNRYGDGYRASSTGLLIWLDGLFNSSDDISTVRVQNLAFDNFLYAAYEAYAAMTIDRDPRLQEYLTRIAREDFAFAMQRHKETGFGEFIHFYEHSYNTSESQYMATISWAAAMLYKLTKDPEYARLAADYINYTLDCQRKEPLGDTIKGFFYRDKSRKSVVHYIHQSREQVYMQALSLLCETQPQHPDYPKWAESVRLYGDYLKGLMQYTAPYGMAPSGVYHINEYRDSVSFYHLHLWPPANAEDLYIEQVKNGVPIDEEHYVKRFPVWFSIFNGNTAIHLSAGKAAAICGNFLKDEELRRIGLEQLYWTVGKNPFGQSLIYGEGYNYPQMDSFSSGEITGEMPVGIRSLDNEDIPYWPQTNNACYKEVWVTSAGKWLALATEYE